MIRNPHPSGRGGVLSHQRRFGPICLLRNLSLRGTIHLPAEEGTNSSALREVPRPQLLPPFTSLPTRKHSCSDFQKHPRAPCLRPGPPRTLLLSPSPCCDFACSEPSYSPSPGKPAGTHPPPSSMQRPLCTPAPSRTQRAPALPHVPSQDVACEAILSTQLWRRAEPVSHSCLCLTGSEQR